MRQSCALNKHYAYIGGDVLINPTGIPIQYSNQCLPFLSAQDHSVTTVTLQNFLVSRMPQIEPIETLKKSRYLSSACTDSGHQNDHQWCCPRTLGDLGIPPPAAFQTQWSRSQLRQHTPSKYELEQGCKTMLSSSGYGKCYWRSGQTLSVLTPVSGH